MTVHKILDQLSSIYGQPTAATKEINDITFRSPYPATDAPKVLFCRIKDCTEIAIHTDCQLINNVIRILLMTGIYQRPFKEKDRLTVPNQTWIALRSLIQQAFQRRINTTAPTAGYHKFAPAQPFQQNAFGILGNDANDDDNIPTQVAALTYQSQLTQSTTANTRQCHDQQMAHIAPAQSATHDTL
jgi:hypothetical protein